MADPLEVIRRQARHRARTPLVATAAAAALALVAAAAVVVLPRDAARAVTTSSCATVDTFVNTGGSNLANRGLFRYDAAGQQLSGVSLAENYGDLAFDSTGTALYGVRLDGGSTPQIDRIDPRTGAVTASRTITGAVVGAATLNGLSGMPGNHLLLGVFGSTALYDVDLTAWDAPSATTVPSSTFSLALPSGYTSGGDFLTLGDGDVLALAARSGTSYLVRLRTGGSTVVGSLEQSYGMAQVAGRIVVATASGKLLSLPSVPTAASTAPLPTAELASTGRPFYGATSTQDSGACNALAASGSSSTFPAGTRPVLTVSGLDASATGTVEFALPDTTPLCTVTLPARSCTAPLLPPGTYMAIGTYSVTGQTSTTTFTVLPVPTAPQPQVVTITAPARVPLTSRTAQATASASSGAPVRFTSSDPSVATVDANGTLTLLSAGTVTVTATADATSTLLAASASTVVTVVAAPASDLPQGVTRLGGADRVATSLQVSAQVFATPADGGATDVVIATSATFADAIAGTRLAGQVQGPLLLTPTNRLDDAVAAEAQRLARTSGTVYLLGNSAALSPAVEAQLRARSTGYRVVRLGGADRYETAVAVAGEVTARGGAGPVYVVTGTDFADGVCLAPYAHRTGGVVLLTDGAALPPSTAAYLATNDPTGSRSVAVGGDAAAARARGGVEAATTIVGRDRYVTSAVLARRFATLRGVDGATGVAAFGLAGGTSWPDALSGAAAMSHLDGPLLLTESGTRELSELTRLTLGGLAADADRAVVFGGPGAVSDGAFSEVGSILKR